MSELQAILLTIITASTPLLLAGLGELVVERSGVLNLGVEGMMVMGAVCGFVAAAATDSPSMGILGAIAAGFAMAMLFAFLTQTLLANQIATGLALTLFGLGVSGLIGESYTGQPGVKVPGIEIAYLSDVPFVGALVFGHDIIVYLSFVLVILVAWVFAKTRLGLIIRAVGDNHDSAHALGYPVVAVRYGCILFGGVCAGLAGGYLSLVYTPQWIENMTAGRGWIALALVIFATWVPARLVLGAYLFGTVWIMGLYVQGLGVEISPQLLAALPYVVTVAALVLISRNRTLAKVNTPACIGRAFVGEQ